VARKPLPPHRRVDSSRPGEAVPSAEILEIAFHRASLVTPKSESKAGRDRLRAELKVVRSSATVLRHLRLEARRFVRPPISEFERALLAGVFGEGSVDRSLTRLKRAEERIRGLTRETERTVHRTSGPEALGTEVRQFYGRLASFVREVDPDLTRLRAASRFLNDRPHLVPGSPTLVIAGFPNVGKSSLVARLSSAHPKVAAYPFTTLSIAIGHADLGFDRLQVVDTPGVLGRPGRSNPAETEATTTVRRAATVVLFVLDPTESSEHSLADQEALLARWREEFPELPMVVVDSKCDLARRATDHLQVSAVTGEGIDALWRAIREKVRPAGAMPPMEEAMTEDEPSRPSVSPEFEGTGDVDYPETVPRTGRSSRRRRGAR
jgi:nucleolar GTP-binding protein